MYSGGGVFASETPLTLTLSREVTVSKIKEGSESTGTIETEEKISKWDHMKIKASAMKKKPSSTY